MNLQVAGAERIDQEHRLIYSLTDTMIVIYSCYSHYK
ncbi:type II toxin-antitoxin system YoeB family toxin [Ferruginibacter sp.]